MRTIPACFVAALFLMAAPLQAEQPANPPQLAQMDPLQFLDYLKTRGPDSGVVTIRNPLRGWIKAEHIPKLIALLDSKVPCAPVVDAHSSFWPPGSTIGKEAGLMIASYRFDAYPIALSASHHSVGTPDELRAWWVGQTSKGVAAPQPSGQGSP
jgi:hypothetical protein